MNLRNRTLYGCLAGALLCVVALFALIGCAAPTPFATGAEVPAPYGCVELRKRGGQC